MGIRISGKELAEQLYISIAEDMNQLPQKPSLGIIVVGLDPVIESFVGIKKRSAERLGVPFIRIDLPDTVSQEELNANVHTLNAAHDGVIVQLPIPKHLSVEDSLSCIDPSRDVDALNPTIPELGKAVHAPVAEAIMEILKTSGVDPKKKKAVVVGAGRLVGAPTAILLDQAGADVHMVTLEQGKLEDAQDADILVSGAGKAGLIQPEHVKEGSILIDAGTSELAKKITGDIDPLCYDKCAFYTPVPGGVGPVAVAMIFKNLVKLVKARG